MNTSIIYKNILGESITMQQALQLQDYHMKEFYEDSMLKKIEHYDSFGEINGFSYYLSSDEDLLLTISNYSKIYGAVSYYFNKETSGSFVTWDRQFYDGMTKLKQETIVYDDRRRIVAHRKFDISNNTIFNTTKYFYFENLPDYVMRPGDEVLEFDYNDPELNAGDIIVYINLAAYEHDGGSIINDNKNIFMEDTNLAVIFNWNGHSFYHSADPLVPTTNV